MGPQGPNPQQVQEFFRFCLRIKHTVNYVPFRGIFCDVKNAYGAAQNSSIHSCMILHGQIFAISFWYQDRYHLLNSCYQVILCDTGIAKISVVSLQYLRTDCKILQTTHYDPTRRQVTDLLQTAAYICCNIQYRQYATLCRKLILFLSQFATLAVAFGTKGRRNQASKVKFHSKYTFLSQSIVIQHYVTWSVVPL